MPRAFFVCMTVVGVIVGSKNKEPAFVHRGFLVLAPIFETETSEVRNFQTLGKPSKRKSSLIIFCPIDQGLRKLNLRCVFRKNPPSLPLTSTLSASKPGLKFRFMGRTKWGFKIVREILNTQNFRLQFVPPYLLSNLVFT